MNKFSNHMKTSYRKLPTATATIRFVRNPNWVREAGEDGLITNMDTYYLEPFEAEVEVLTVHFRTRKMRVRYVSPDGTIDTFDTDADNFFAKYPIA
jgi:hypothetical protein